MSYLTGSYMGLYYNIIIDRYSNPEFSVVLNLHPDLHGLHSGHILLEPKIRIK